MDFQQNTEPNNNDNISNTPGMPNTGAASMDNTSENTPEQSASDINVPEPAQTAEYVKTQNNNNVQAPYQNNPTNTPYSNGNAYNGNNGYNNNHIGYNSNYNSNNGYNYNTPYNYGRPIYRQNVQEPGSNLASAAKVLGIISIIMCFTFTVYPAFITGATAIVLALLSKGNRPKLPSNAKNGIIAGIAGLTLNTILIISSIIMLFTNDAVRAQVNETFESQYGQTFDEMLEEILENNGYTD